MGNKFTRQNNKKTVNSSSKFSSHEKNSNNIIPNAPCTNEFLNQPPTYSTIDDDLDRLSTFLTNINNIIEFNQLTLIIDSLIVETNIDDRHVLSNEINIPECRNLFYELINFKTSTSEMTKLKKILIKSAFEIVKETEKKNNINFKLI